MCCKNESSRRTPPTTFDQQTSRINPPTKYFTFGDKSCPFFVLVPSLLILCEVSQNRVTAVHSTVRFNVTDIENNYQAMLNVCGASESVCQKQRSQLDTYRWALARSTQSTVFTNLLPFLLAFLSFFLSFCLLLLPAQSFLNVFPLPVVSLSSKTPLPACMCGGGQIAQVKRGSVEYDQSLC